MGVETALIIGATAAAAGTGASIYSGRRQREEARDLRHEAEDEQHRLQKRLESEKSKTEATDAARLQRRRQRALVSATPSGQEAGVSSLGIPQYGLNTGRTALG